MQQSLFHLQWGYVLFCEIQASKILQLLLIPELHVETIIILSTSEHIAVFPSCSTAFCNLNSYDSFQITYLNKIILYKEFSGVYSDAERAAAV